MRCCRIPDRHSPFSPAAVRSILLRVCCLLALGSGGCGVGTYQQSGSLQNAPAGYQWSSLYRGDVKSVAVPIFANKTFYRGFEFNLTKAVVNQLEGQSPYKVMPKERADTILEGEIERVHVRTISNSPFNSLPQEQLLEVTVNFTWKDLRSGRILARRHDFRQTAPYYPTLGEGQYTGEQQNLERLALAIVQELQAEW
jgi:lipopolysaccharide assembly LptE-like protein